jgi:hypothetical protein
LHLLDMADSAHMSIYVAPLQITKGRPRMPSTTSTGSGGRGMSQSSPSGQITPPPTPPQDSTDDLTPRPPVQHVQFHDYLRAFHPYHPPYDETSATVTLPLNAGDIVLVHSVHTNGWADGTLLLSGARGWLPTNFCEALDHEPIRPLMTALTSFWEVVKGCGDGDFAPVTNQNYMRGLIAGVRYLLVSRWGGKGTVCWANRPGPNRVSESGIGPGPDA